MFVGRQGAEVHGDGGEVFVGHVLVAVDRDPFHQALDVVAIGLEAALQQLHHVLHGPIADAGLRVWGDVGGRLSLGSVGASRHEEVPLQPAGPIPGGVALAAVGDRPDEVGAAVPLGRLAGVRRPPALVKIAPLPAGQEEAPAERRRQLVRPVLLPYGFDAGQVRLEGQDVLVRHVGERGVGKGREQVFAAAADAPPHGPKELLVAPPADAGLSVRRDVGAVDGPEGDRDGVAARELGAIVVVIGVAGDAEAGPGQVCASSDRVVRGVRQLVAVPGGDAGMGASLDGVVRGLRQGQP